MKQAQITESDEFQSTALLVFLKAPIEGNVKTRLAETIGSKQALLCYQALVERQLSALPPSSRVEIHFSPGAAGDLIRAWLGNDFEYHPQVEGDLGARLSEAVRAAFHRGAERVLCLGGDCPGLGQAQLAAGIRALQDGRDGVIGPTEDGGYYLIGLNAPHTALFESIPWSSEHTFQASMERAKALPLDLEPLEMLYDVDREADWNRAVSEGLVKPN